MKRNKNRMKSVISKEDPQLEEEMHILADSIAEGKPQTSALADPFEDYVDVLRTKIHANPHVFRSRLAKGYNALLQTLQEGDGSSENRS